MAKASAGQNRYEAIIEKIFKRHHVDGKKRLPFDREEIETAASQLRIALPKNLGDLIYSFRYRSSSRRVWRSTNSDK
jgi:hypothetical protein